MRSPSGQAGGGSLLLAVLCLLSALGPIATDVYLPLMPQMAHDLHASDSQAQLTLTSILIGIALGQVVTGPLGDRFGRRAPLLIGLSVFALANLASALVDGVLMLIVVRFVAGFAAASALVTSRAVVADVYPGPAAARAYSVISSVLGIGPAVAPLLGGSLSKVTDWRGIFLVLVGISLAMLAVTAVGVRESLPADRRRPANPRAILSGLWDCLRHKEFLALSVSVTMTGGMLFSYIGSSSFVLEGHFGLSPVMFAVVFSANAFGLLLLANVNRWLVRSHDPSTLLWWGQGLAVVGALVVAFGVFAGPAIGLALPSVLLGLWLCLSSLGLVMPNSTAAAMRIAPGGAGAASGVLGISQFLVGGLLAPLGGVSDSPVPLAVLLLTCALLGPIARYLLTPR